MSLVVGEVLQGKYRIVRMIGEGGMGAVYEGENTLISRRVAIKVMLGSVAEQKDLVIRFEREAQAAGKIGNDHILEVLDLGVLENGDRFMVMEYLDGEALSDRITGLGRMTAEGAADMVRQTLVGLQAAHAAGIVHRDIKPENIFILKEKAGHKDYVKLIDFGISKFNALTTEDGFRMTATGVVMGTPYYMSPEQAKGSNKADHRSDLYAMGVILYECVTGDVPFHAKSFNELLFQIVLSDLKPAREIVPDLDVGIDSIITKAMAREPESRFQTAADFIAALDAWENNRVGVSAPPPGSPDPQVRAGMASSHNLQTGAVPVQTGAVPVSRQSGGFEPTQVGDVSAPDLLGGGVLPTRSDPDLETGASASSWAKTQGEVPAGTQGSSKGVMMLAAAVAAVALVGVGYVMSSGGEPTAEDTGPGVPSATPVMAAKPIAEDPSEIAPAASSAVKPSTEDESPEAAKEGPEPVTVKVTPAAKPKPVAAKPKPRLRVKAKPRAVLRKVVKPKPKPKSKKPKAITDFGY
ncbi:MAG: protein kinase [Polyangiaceae bacterium]|nr:protein kinase [Polyangiaceae bacterium]